MIYFIKTQLRYSAILFLSFVTVSSASAESLYGMFMVVKGDIKIEKKDKTINPAKVGLKVQAGETVISGPDSRAKIVMADRNVINISPDTKLMIAKYDNDAKSGEKNVQLELIQGKVRNNVEQSYDGKKSKFLIKTPTAVAGVRGTQFMTSFNPVTNVTQVVTLKGVVFLAPANVTNPSPSQIVEVKKGESSSVESGQPPAPPQSVPKEELKQVDKDTQAAKKPEEPVKKDVAQQENNSPSASGAENSPERSPANAPPKAAVEPPPKSMIAAKDMDTSLAREIKNPLPTAGGGALQPPPRLFVPPPVPLTPPPNPLIGEIIRRTVGKTTLTITPQKD